MESPHTEQPPIGANPHLGCRLCPLGQQPSPIGVMDNARNTANSAFGAAYPGSYAPFRGEQRHLGVVGNRADPPIGLHVIVDPRLPAEPADFGERPKFDPRPKSVADGTAE